jgi:hypothetical protein
MAEKENTSYSRGEKWWDLEGVKNPILTAQPPLLDGAEGELLSPAATLTVEGITAGESNDRITAATRIGGGGHKFAVPSHGSTAGTPGPEDVNLPYGPLTPSAISAGAVIDPPPVLFSGLEPPRLEATGERVTGADTPKHRIENKRRRRVLLASQQPQTQWSVYQGDFDFPDPVAPLETHRGEMCPAGLALHHPAADLLKEWATYGCPTQTGKPWTREEMQAAIKRGPHRSALSDEAIAHFKAEVDKKVRIGQAKLVAWDSIKDNPPPPS